MFHKADNVLKKILNQKGLYKTASSAHVCYEAEKIISKLFPNFKSRVSVKSFSGGVLKLHSDSPIINQEIEMQKKEIIKTANQKIGEGTIKDVIYIG